MNKFDVIVIGGGQSGLAVGYYLRQTGLTYIILDSQKEAGGAWLKMWESLQLFSPAQWSSLPGMMMQWDKSIKSEVKDLYPKKDAVVEYLSLYEAKYHLLVKRKVTVNDVIKVGEDFQLQTTDGLYFSRAIVSATGTFSNPYVPEFAGQDKFRGIKIHACEYRSPEVFNGKRVAVIGEGNSGAQILAELSKATQTIWITQKEPRFLPDHVDGRHLFDVATQMYEAQKSGKQFKPPSLGDIVMVDSVKDARSRGALVSLRPFDYFTEDSIVWQDGRKERIDAVIFCTGFKPALSHLEGLKIIGSADKPETLGTKSRIVDGLWFVGYGNWTGFASATLVGVGRSAKKTVEEIVEHLSNKKERQVS